MSSSNYHYRPRRRPGLLTFSTPPPTVTAPDFIDLTTTSSPENISGKRKREGTYGSTSDDTGEGASQHGKRPRRANTSSPRSALPAHIPVIDLESDDDDDGRAFRQRLSAEQVQSQQRHAAKDAGPPKLTRLTCVICWERPTDLTVTDCGHFFCHECLIQALNASENQAMDSGEPRKSQCPVCRKKISRGGRNPQVIPLLLKKKPV